MSKKFFKRSFVGTMMILFLFLFLPKIEIKAFPGNYYWYPKEMHVRIYHPASGMYLGIARDGNEQDGAQLQLQYYEEGNQNQIFYLRNMGKNKNGKTRYQIRIHGEENKIIEVKDSSTKDCASIVQCTAHDKNSGKWYFFTETRRGGYDSAVCCIRNVKSGKMLNVNGGRHYDGNNMIQYHEDGTSSEVFEIKSVENDVIGATWNRKWSGAKNLNWPIVRDTKENRKKI